MRVECVFSRIPNVTTGRRYTVYVMHGAPAIIDDYDNVLIIGFAMMLDGARFSRCR